MTIDFQTEMSSVLDGNIPEWFYTLSVEQRNTVMNIALTKYSSVTIDKNNKFLVYWANLVASYQPKV